MPARFTKEVNEQNKLEMQLKIGKYLKRERERAKITQQAVAKRAGLSTAQYVSNVERGVSPPSIEFLKTVIELYQLAPEDVAFFISKAQHDFYLAELSPNISKMEPSSVVRQSALESDSDIKTEVEHDIIEPEYKRIA